MSGDGDRGRTVTRKQLAHELRVEREAGVVDLDLERVRRELDEARPRRRADCADIPRPCPFLSCRHHLYLDVNPRTGSVKFNFPGKEPWELEETCALDVAEKGGVTLERVGELSNLTRERVRQIETRGLVMLRSRVEG